MTYKLQFCNTLPHISLQKKTNLKYQFPKRGVTANCDEIRVILYQEREYRWFDFLFRLQHKNTSKPLSPTESGLSFHAKSFSIK